VAHPPEDSGAPIPLADLPLTAEEVARARLVDFAVDRDAELPVGTQLGWKLRGMIVRGVLRCGDRVPSVRDLADFAGVNVNTARAAYRGLEEDGLICSEHGKGTFVTDAAAGLGELAELAAGAAAEARGRGLDPRDLAAAIYSDPGDADAADPIEPFPAIDPGLDSGELHRELREQIGRLEREIAAYAWHDPASPTPPRPRGGGPVGRVVAVDELERTRAELIDRLRRLRGEAAQRGAREEASRAYLEAMVGEPAAHRWEMVTTEGTGEPGCRSWRVVPAWGPVGAIMGWWRVKVSSGCPLVKPPYPYA
jgi:DNA-binding transcriptional regulator YhcF (GntR family)